MACTRGCVGTPICSALDICCIQFRQDCGSGCGGLADGYSRVQVLANGNLEICSNVGGVCDCCAPPCEIVIPDTCDDGGVGDDYMLRTFDLLDGVLTIGGAPEHFTVRADNVLGSGGEFGTGHPSSVGPYPDVITHSDLDLLVTNPSECRDLEVQVTAYAYFIFHDIDAFTEVQGTLVFDGISMVEITTTQALIPRWGGTITVVRTFTIPAGGFVNFNLILNSSTFTVGGFDRSSWRLAFSAIGSTT